MKFEIANYSTTVLAHVVGNDKEIDDEEKEKKEEGSASKTIIFHFVKLLNEEGSVRKWRDFQPSYFTFQFLIQKNYNWDENIENFNKSLN